MQTYTGSSHGIFNVPHNGLLDQKHMQSEPEMSGQTLGMSSKYRNKFILICARRRFHSKLQHWKNAFTRSAQNALHET
jgi:hypothetical protein